MNKETTNDFNKVDPNIIKFSNPQIFLPTGRQANNN
jgi:hypothetical protein